MQKVLVFDDHSIVFEDIRMLLGEKYELHYATRIAMRATKKCWKKNVA